MAYTPEQRRNIALANRLSAGHAPRVRQALLEAMGVESNFRNLTYGDRDSLGVLQQRRQYYPNAGKNVAYDIQQFLVRADRANKQVGGSAGTLAQAVQRSAFPGRYDEHASQAASLLGGRFSGGGGSPGLDLASRLGGPQTGAQGGTDLAKQALTSFLLQSSNELASGQHPDPNAILGYALARQQAEQPSAPSQGLARHASTGSPTGGAGVVNFDGKPVAAWIGGILEKARAAGWKGTVNSGYRSVAEQRRIYNSGVRPAAKPGQSNHNFTAFPGGAVDVTDPEGLAATLKRLGVNKLVWAGSKDPVHFSHPHNGGY